MSINDRKLAPCPFCGNDDACVTEEDGDKLVQCISCYAEGPPVYAVPKRGSSRLAAEAWNRRAPSAPTEALERVVEALERIKAGDFQSPLDAGLSLDYDGLYLDRARKLACEALAALDAALEGNDG